jgi:hypothetical protein
VKAAWLKWGSFGGMKLGLQFSILAIPAILAINQAATTRLKWGLTRDLLRKKE